MSCDNCSTARQEPSLASATKPSHVAGTAVTVSRGLGSGRRMNSSTSSFCGTADDEDEAAAAAAAVGWEAVGTGGGRVRGGGCCKAAAAAAVTGSCCAGSRVGTGSRGGTAGGSEFVAAAALGLGTSPSSKICALCCCDKGELLHKENKARLSRRTIEGGRTGGGSGRGRRGGGGRGEEVAA